MRFPRRILALVIAAIVCWNLSILYRATRVPSENIASQNDERPVPQSTSTGDKKGAGHVVEVATEPELEVVPDVKPEAASDPQPEKHKPSKEASNKGTGKIPAFPDLPSGYRAGLDEVSKVIDHMLEVHPKHEPFTKYLRTIGQDNDFYQNGELAPTSTILGMYLQVPDEDVAALQTAHNKVIDSLPKELPPNSWHGRGIVMTGGGKYFPLVVTAIKWLRETNVNLPIEVFMQDESEWEPKFCNEAFPTLNVKCVNLEQVYGRELLSKVESKYTLKPLAMLASQFEEMYFLDADSVPLDDLEPLFNAEPYTKTGMVLNSDYWERYVSPRYYEIANITLGGRARGDADSRILRQADREHAIPGKSSESGQILFDKKRHFRSLLLTMYYNIFGQGCYFPLLMQGGPGEGDKDTYAAAAFVLGEPFYQTERAPATLGGPTNDGSFRGYAMLQTHPSNDYFRNELHKDVPDKFLFLHSNNFKANPRWMLMDHNEHIRGVIPLQKTRYYGPLSSQHKETIRPKEDIEYRYFSAMTDTVCDWARQREWIPRDWADEDLERMCGYFADHLEWLKDPANDEANGPVRDLWSTDKPAPPAPKFWKSRPLHGEPSE